jgi:hypothetical protein
VTLEATASGLVSSRLALDQPATGVRIPLSRGGVLVGNVSDASGGAPGEVDVSVLDTQDEDAIGRYDYPRLDARGNFRSRLLPGRYVVTASRDGEALAKVEVTLDEGQEARVALTLPVR